MGMEQTIRGPFPTEEGRKKLIEAASQNAIGEAEQTAVKLYYSETGNNALGEAYAQGMESEDIIQHVMNKLRERYSEEYGNWNEIEEHLTELVEGAA